MSDPNWKPPANTLCVGALVVREKEILLVRQASGHDLAGQWTIPWGFVDEGEWAHEAALRETVEEAGVAAEMVGLIGVQDLRPAGWLSLIYLCNHKAGDPKFDGVEADGAAYFTVAQLDAMDEPLNGLVAWILKRYLSGDYQVLKMHFEDGYYGNRAGFF